MSEAKSCVINLWNEHGWDLDVDMLEFVMQRVVVRHAPQAVSIDIYPQEREPQELPAGRCYHRDPPGWCEWIVNIKYRGGGGMTIGCIQRALGAMFETHS